MNVMRTLPALLALAAGLAVPAVAATPKLKGAALVRDARVPLAAARRTALKARPGTVTEQELEKEPGGSGLRYSFVIASRGKPYEVGVDAKTGAVLENVAEGKNPD